MTTGRDRLRWRPDSSGLTGPASPLAADGHPATTGIRCVRATVAGVASASLAVAAHVAAGGAPPSIPLIIIAAGLLTRLAYGVAARRRALPALLAALACSQFALHVAFVLSGHQATGPDHHHLVTPAELFAYSGESCWTNSGLMIMAHLVAVLATGVLLYRAEELLWAAVALRAALHRTSALVLGPLAAAAVLLRRLLTSTIMDLPSTAGLGAAAVATAPPVSPRGAPVGRVARWRGPPAAPRRVPTPV